MKLRSRLIALFLLAICALTAHADKTVVHVVTLVTTVSGDSTVTTRIANIADQVIPDSLTAFQTDSMAMVISSPMLQSIIGNATDTVAASIAKKQSATKVPTIDNQTLPGTFAWEAEAGSSIDMSGNDMSALDIAASFGYKRGLIKFLGVGAAMNVMVNNSARSFPIYLAFKTNFRKRPSLVFMDLRCGMSLNYLPNDYQQNAFYGMLGLGVNLAQGKKFSSYLVLGYTFKQFNDIETSSGSLIKLNDIHSATVKLGVTF
ncbi:MAG: hypothetical protein K2J10_04905 [Muribaculaceae bacterium]|nr:hypothetical protein [Muribaculaceae bacterium]